MTSWTGGAVAALLGFLLAVTPALEALHAGLVRHVACPEHGELIESEEGTGALGPATGQAGTAFERGAPRGLSLLHAHGHCVLAQHAGGRGVQDRPAPSNFVAASSPAPPTRTACAGPSPSVAILRRAPKASPPQV